MDSYKPKLTLRKMSLSAGDRRRWAEKAFKTKRIGI